MGSKNDLSNRINESYSKLSKGQKLLATYITDNYDKAVFLTAAKLGEVVGVSESTVVRFAMHLGYRGYPEFQSALEELVRNKLNSIQRMEVTYGRISQSKILESVLKSDAEKINSTLEIATSASESDFYEEDMDAESENGQELLLEEIKNDKMYVYDYIPDKLYLAECHTMLGTINFSLVNNYMDVDLRQYNLQIPDKIIDEISDAVNYIRGYMGRE